MTDPFERLEHLERRVAQLETLVRQLATRALEAPARSTIAPAPAPAPIRTMRVAPTPARDWEQWVGRRALLGVGVFALIATAGFFLKYAIDRGWISPWMRVNGGVLLGALIAVGGDVLVARGLRAYGGAIIGAGGGLAYLALWAAATPYGLIDPKLGVLLLLGVTLGVAARAVRHHIEALCAWALLGALSAPFFVTPPATGFGSLLVYIGLVTLGGGAIAARLGWRATFALAAGGFFLMPLLVPAHERVAPEFAGYVVLGAAALLLATERRWPEPRVLGALVGWTILLALAADAILAEWRWFTLAGAFLITLVGWRQHVARDPFAAGPLETLLFVASPLLTIGMSTWAGPAELEAAGGAVPALLALPYLAAGWPRRSLALVWMGFALVALAIAGQWDGQPVSVGWSALALVAVAADRWNGQPAGRPAAMVIATLSLLHLFTVARTTEGIAWVDGWSLAWYACTGAYAAAAAIWQTATPEEPWLQGGRTWMWTLAGVSLWLGGSLELSWAFPNDLARDLAISAFWLVYAGALVAVGFRLAQRSVRVAGLLLAGLAAAKIVLYDLSQLDALYRVGSFFALAIIALAVAYAYNRRRATASAR